jgi:Patatin-like phospholipase
VSEVLRTAGTDEGMLRSVKWGVSPDRSRGRLRWLLTGERRQPRCGWIGLYEPPSLDRDDVGVCCSGGGIRSAAFNLGALQTLQDQEHRVLQRSKYLAAVSGGSYIAAAFCMVAKTWKDPKDDDSDPALVNDDAPPFCPGSPEEQYLRNHLGYLAPDGLSRAYLGLRLLAGLLLNVVIIGLPVLLAGLLVGWGMRGRLRADAAGAHHFDVPPGVVWPVLGVAAAALALALLDVMRRTRRDICQKAIQTWELRCFLFAVGGGLVLIALPWLAGRALDLGDVSIHQATLRSAGAAVSSVGALFVAAIGHVRGRVRDEKALLADAEKRLGRYARQAREALIALVVLLVGPLLLLFIALVGLLIAAGTDSVAPLVAGAVALLGVLYVITDLNTISLHPFYRRRLASAFALKRVLVNGAPRACERDFDTIVELSKSGVEPGSEGVKAWPMLVVCAAANVSDPGATPPGRPVASFTFSPKGIGGPLTGAAPTAYYEADLSRNRKRDVTLPAAVAMSGAALSPSMGKMTYRPLTFLLGLANIRLGVWVPNPAHVNDRHERRELRHPPRLSYLWKEVAGRNRLDDKFLYVTDGGHYENLGLVELLRRGCRTIYCFDAGGGSSGKALGDAISLARTELDVEIEMLPDEAAALAEDATTHLAQRACARGRIRYPARDGRPEVDGTLFYVSSVLSEDAPWSLRLFRESDELFPHHSTMDQFFTDQQFEAYRLLGASAAERALELERLDVPAVANGAGPQPADVSSAA